MLTAFPIQTLADANAMVEFSRFPSALGTAAEIYANLERIIRLAQDGERAGIFAEYTAQMQRVDAQTQVRLSSLRLALRLAAEAETPQADPPGQV